MCTSVFSGGEGGCGGGGGGVWLPLPCLTCGCLGGDTCDYCCLEIASEVASLSFGVENDVDGVLVSTRAGSTCVLGGVETDDTGKTGGDGEETVLDGEVEDGEDENDEEVGVGDIRDDGETVEAAVETSEALVAAKEEGDGAIEDIICFVASASRRSTCAVEESTPSSFHTVGGRSNTIK